jgi:hypothetical protein
MFGFDYCFCNLLWQVSQRQSTKRLPGRDARENPPFTEPQAKDVRTRANQPALRVGPGLNKSMPQQAPAGGSARTQASSSARAFSPPKNTSRSTIADSVHARSAAAIMYKGRGGKSRSLPQGRGKMLCPNFSSLSLVRFPKTCWRRGYFRVRLGPRHDEEQRRAARGREPSTRRPHGDLEDRIHNDRGRMRPQRCSAALGRIPRVGPIAAAVLPGPRSGGGPGPGQEHARLELEHVVLRPRLRTAPNVCLGGPRGNPGRGVGASGIIPHGGPGVGEVLVEAEGKWLAHRAAFTSSTMRFIITVDRERPSLCAHRLEKITSATHFDLGGVCPRAPVADVGR